MHVTFAREAECEMSRRSTASCSAPTSSSTGTTTATTTFDDFLATLNSRHRKAIKRERREALAIGITIHWLTGDATRPKTPGMRSSRSTWRPARANGAAPI